MPCTASFSVYHALSVVPPLSCYRHMGLGRDNHVSKALDARSRCAWISTEVVLRPRI